MNAGKELYQMLAESNHRTKDCLRIGSAAAASVESRHQSMLKEIEDLRDRIEEMGIGGDPASEDRYFELLRDFRSLHQSHALSSFLPAAPEDVDPDLEKALDYASLMLSVYRPGALIKGADDDLRIALRQLRQWSSPLADSTAKQIQSLIEHG